MSARFTLTAAAAFALLAAQPARAHGPEHGEEAAYGMPGDPKKPARVVNVTMREHDGRMLFVPDRIEIRRGEQIRFVVRNTGELEHEIVVATLAENLKHGEEMKKNPDMEHDDPNARRLKPKASGELLWRFTKAGAFDFSCLIPGHRESGMFGTIIVK